MKRKFWKAKDGYRWRVIARNGKIVAESGEAYSSRSNVKRAYLHVWYNMPFGGK